MRELNPKEIVNENSIAIRSVITMTPPEIVETKSKEIQMAFFGIMLKHGIISRRECIELRNETIALYGI